MSADGICNSIIRNGGGMFVQCSLFRSKTWNLSMFHSSSTTTTTCYNSNGTIKALWRTNFKSPNPRIKLDPSTMQMWGGYLFAAKYCRIMHIDKMFFFLLQRYFRTGCDRLEACDVVKVAMSSQELIYHFQCQVLYLQGDCFATSCIILLINKCKYC